MYAQKGKEFVEAVAAIGFDTAYAMFDTKLKQQISKVQFRKDVNGGEEFPVRNIAVIENDIECERDKIGVETSGCAVTVFY